MSAKRRLVYILSPSYSGSTLLTLLLAQHQDIATMGELKATAMGPIENYRCSCGELIEACDFWQQLQLSVKKQNKAFSLQNFGTHFGSASLFSDRILRAQVRGPIFESIRQVGLSLPGVAAEFQQIIENNQYFIEQTCRLQDKSIFLDGSKDPHRLKYLMQSNLWDIKVIRMYRDGRAQSNSQRKKGYHGGDYASACHEWKSTIAQMHEVSALLPKDDLITIKYESLCADPNAVMESLWQFLDIPSMEQDWSSVDLRQTPHHIIGNSMRTKSQISIKVDDAWKETLSDDDLTAFNNIAASTNHQLGYGD